MAQLIEVDRLLKGPNPLPFVNVRNPEAVDEVRKLGCLHYNDCLTIAFRRDWEGFHCNSCDDFISYPIVEDYEGCAKVVRELSAIASFSLNDNDVIDLLKLCKKDL